MHGRMEKMMDVALYGCYLSIKTGICLRLFLGFSEFLLQSFLICFEACWFSNGFPTFFDISLLLRQPLYDCILCLSLSLHVIICLSLYLSLSESSSLPVSLSARNKGVIHRSSRAPGAQRRSRLLLLRRSCMPRSLGHIHQGTK